MTKQTHTSHTQTRSSCLRV